MIKCSYEECDVTLKGEVAKVETEFSMIAYGLYNTLTVKGGRSKISALLTIHSLVNKGIRHLEADMQEVEE